MIFTNIDYIVIITTAIFTFLSLEGYLGVNIKKIFRFFYNPVIFEYFFLILFVIILLYFIYKNINIIKIYDNDEDKAVNISNRLNIFKVNIPINSIATNIGVGAAVGAGFTAAATVVKNTSLPPIVKIGTVASMGLMGALLTKSNSNSNTIDKFRINLPKDNNSISIKNSDSATVNSTSNVGPNKDSFIIDNGNLLIDENLSNNDNFYYLNYKINTIVNNINDSFKSLLNFINGDNNNNNPVVDLLYSNYYMHVITLYLSITLLYVIITYFICNNYKLKFLKILLGEGVYNFLYKIYIKINSFNKFWIFFILILLIINCIINLYYSNYILNNIDIISEIVKNTK